MASVIGEVQGPRAQSAPVAPVARIVARVVALASGCAMRALTSVGRGRGQGLVEYALIILFVAIAVALALSMLAPTLNSIFRSIPPAL